MTEAFRRDANWREEVRRPISGEIERAGREALYRLARWLIPRRDPAGFSFDGLRKILVIKEPYRMGDLMQITPTLRALRRRFPSARIGLLIQDRNLPVFRHNPDIDRIFAYRKKDFNARPWEIVSFLREIRREKYDLAAVLETQRVHMTNDLLALFSGARFRLRYDGSALGNARSNVFYSLLSPYRPGAHEVDQNCKVFEPYGLRLERRELVLKFTDQELAAARKALDLAVGPGEPPVLIHPGAYKINNRWPLERYLEIGRRMKGRGIRMVFALGPSEREWEGTIRKEGLPVLAGLSLPDMIAALSLFRLVLCNDTGILHLSAAVGTRTVTLFGDTYPERWTPPGGLVTVLQAADKSLASISVEEVWSALSRQLRLEP